ncbi:MAG: tetratricopeptide repeat protein [Candidatus Hodarchaeota archaeon]
MSDSHVRDLTRVERLIYEGKFNQAYQIVESFEKKKGITPVDRLTFLLLKSQILIRKGDFQDALRVAEDALTKSRRLTKPLQEVDAFIAKVEALWYLESYDDSLAVIKQAESRLQILEKAHPLEVVKRGGVLIHRKGTIYKLKGELNQALRCYRQSLALSKKINDKRAIAASLNNLGIIYWQKGDLDEALEYYQQSLALRKELDIKQDIAVSLNNLGLIYQQRGNLDQALDYFEQSLTLKQEIGTEQEIAASFTNIAVVFQHKGDLEKALKYYHQSLAIFENIGYKQHIAASLNNLGMIYRQKGDLDQALNFFQKSLAITEKTGNKGDIARGITNLGIIYHQKGNLEQALEYFERSLILFKEIGNKLHLSDILFQLVSVAIDKNSLDQAKGYLQHLQQLRAQEENRILSQRARIAEALLLKTSTRARSRGKAEELLEEIIEEEIMEHELTLVALLNLSELFLVELRITNDPEVLREMQVLVTRLLDIAKQQHSHWLLAETYLLQAKLALLELDLQETRRLLTQAQVLADEKGLHKLAMKISSEHDSLLDQITQWESSLEQQTSLAELTEMTDLDEQIARMLRQRMAIVPELPDEEPVLLLILTGSGLIAFERTFLSESRLNQSIMGAFLSAIQTFSTEAFARSIDRVKLEEYTLLIKTEEPFQFCYIFKGQTYTAQQRLNQFTQVLRNTTLIWGSLLEFLETSQFIEGAAQLALENLLTEVFSS